MGDFSKDVEISPKMPYPHGCSKHRMGLSAAAMKMPQKRHIVVFDLDGTLVDTVADIASATNETLAEFGAKPLSLAIVMRMIGDGSP